MTRVRTWSLALLAASSLGLAACGSSTSSEGTTAPPSTLPPATTPASTVPLATISDPFADSCYGVCRDCLKPVTVAREQTILRALRARPDPHAGMRAMFTNIIYSPEFFNPDAKDE